MGERVMVITGGFGALGRATAKAAAQASWRVVAADHATGAPPGLAEALGPDGLTRGGVDLTDAPAAEALVADIAARFGRIDALINIAGGFVWQTAAEGDPTAWDRMHRLNLTTALNACRAALPHLAGVEHGRIVNIGAAAALKAASGMGAYAASKAGVHALTQSLAEEWKGRVTVNAVLPSIIDTPANRADMPDADPAAWVTTEELAAVILFLASPEASGVTGALIPVIGRV